MFATTYLKKSSSIFFQCTYIKLMPKSYSSSNLCDCGTFSEILLFYVFTVYVKFTFNTYVQYMHWDTPFYYRVGPPFAFRTALILRGIDSTRCWKHSSEILVHIDMIASHSCCRFVDCSSMMRISRSTTSQRCSIGLRSGNYGGH